MTIPVRIKRSNVNGTPGSLLEGELAFSNDYLTNTGDGSLYIGADNDAAGIVIRKIGGVDTVYKSLFDANTILSADTDNTPAALTVPEQTIVGRITAGSIDALTATEVRTLLGIEANAAADQNLWETIAIDNTDVEYTWAGTDGNIVADTTTDTVTFVAGSNITIDRDATLDAIRITSSASGNTFENFVITDTDSGYTWTETGTATASGADSIDFVSGTSIDIDVDATSKAVKIINTAPNVDQNLFSTIDGDSGGPVSADGTTNTLDILGSGLISTAVTDAAGTTTLTISTTATGDQNLFSTIDGDSGGPVSADGTTNTLDVVGSGVISTAVSDAVGTTTLTISSTAEANQNAFQIVTGDSGTATADAAGDTIAITGLTGITTAATAGAAAGLTIDLDDTAVTPGSYGDAATASTFTVDQQGRLTAAGETSIQITESQITDGTILARLAANETVTGDWDFSGGGTLIVPTPTGGTEAANKDYVDDRLTGIDYKDSVRIASTADIAGTYTNTGGSSARGQFTGMSNANVDGVALAASDRILLKDQTGSGAENGIWVITTLGTGSNGVWDRATDFDEDAEVTSGSTCFVEEGTVNAGQRWSLTTADPIIIGGASGTVLTWTQTGGDTLYSAGDGLDLTGTVFSVDADPVGTITVGAGGIEVTPRTANYVGIYDASGDLNAEQYLSSVRGGTGVTTPAVNTFLYGSGAAAMSTLAAATGGTAGAHYIMAEPANGGAPVWLTEIDGGTY